MTGRQQGNRASGSKQPHIESSPQPRLRGCPALLGGVALITAGSLVWAQGSPPRSTSGGTAPPARRGGKPASPPAPPAAQPSPRRPAQPAPVRIEPPPRTPLLSLAFTDVEVRQILATAARYAGLDIVVTGGATGSLSVTLTNQPPDAAVRLIAAAAGLSVLRLGPSYIVGPAQEVRAAAAALGGGKMLVPLRHLTVEEARAALERLAPLVTVQPAGRNVVLTGVPEELMAARAALEQADVERPVAPPAQGTDVFTLRHTDPEEVARVLREAFPEARLARQERTLIISGTVTDLESIRRAIASVDAEQAPAPKPPEEQSLSIYRLQYLDATRAEETLKKALPSVSVTAAPEAFTLPPADFRPLSLSGAFGGSQALGGLGGLGGGLGVGGGLTGTGSGSGQQAQGSFSRSTRLILSGPAPDVERARRILAETDVAPEQVAIFAELVEVDISALRDLGVRWDFDRLAPAFTFEPGEFMRFGRVTRAASGFNVAVRALVTQNRARILASPNISALDNEDASIFIGDLIRFPGTNLVTPNSGTLQGTETVPVGIALLVRPRVHPGGDVTLKVHPVVSTVSQFVRDLPQTASREADTTVRLARGEALVIGGLKRNETTTEIRKVPGLGDLPLIGQFFRSKSRRRRNTEVVIIIEARAVSSRPGDNGPETDLVPPSTLLPGPPGEPALPSRR